MHDSKIYYFGVHPNVLEPISLEISSFGALWYEDNKQRYIVGYGFGPDQIDNLSEFCKYSAHFTCMDRQILSEIYRSVREKQQKRDWLTRKKLALLAAFKEPWNKMDVGWYVLRSRQEFPLHLSIVHKTRYSVWLEHAAVCENEAELVECIDKAKQAHHLTAMAAMNVQGGHLYE